MAAPTPKTPTTMDNIDAATQAFYEHSTAKRINTDATVFDTIRKAHPDSLITIVPEFTCPLHAYGQAFPHIDITPLSPDSKLSWLIYLPPARRLDYDTGALISETFYEIFTLRYAHQEYLIYFIDGRDGTQPYGVTRNQYIVSARDDNGVSASILSQLIREVGTWMNSLHNEIWVFEQGWWRKDASLYHNIMQSHWSDVILHSALKQDLINTVSRFFNSRAEYARLGVPWKRGLIFYGPPGNGKTISIKATMHTLYSRPVPVPTLYVKSLNSFAGPEYSISQIFERARAEAPCYLVFEDLDSMVTDDVRSFFLNAVDGLSLNEGVLMVGSTNHLDRLDPGIAKRPSRFDRKYLFDDPDEALRERYARFWRGKVLGKGKGKGKSEAVEGRAAEEGEDFEDAEDGGGQQPSDPVEFPEVLCAKIAGITGGFSFAYMQEAFLASLLSIANRRQQLQQVHPGDNGDGDGDGDDRLAGMMERLGEQWELLDLEEEDFDAFDDGEGWVDRKAAEGDGERKQGNGKHGDGDGGKDDDELDKYELWREMKKQVENLRKEMGRDKGK